MKTLNLKAWAFIITLVILSYVIFNNYEVDIRLILFRLESHKATYSALSTLLLGLDAILPLPSSILMFLNGKVLGLTLGTSLSLFGTSLGSIIAYYIGFYFNRLTGDKKINKFSEQLISNHGIAIIMVTRAIPVISEATMMYAGIQARKIKSILIYIILGNLPVSIVYSILGNYMFETKGFFIALVGSIIFSTITIGIIAKKRKMEIRI